MLARIHECATSLASGLGGARAAAERFDAPLRARVDAGALRSGELGEELRRLGAAEVGLRHELEEATERVTTAEVELARLDAETEEARRRLEAAAAEPAEGDDRDELAARAERLETRRTALGQVNPLAREEYDVEKERLTDLQTQRQDLERSLEELERLRADLAETVERRFAETFASVAQNFEEVAATLFPGGEGRLRLVEPDEEESEHGVEVELRPAGKRITRLSLLSGGEKALGAISFLFALFLARPCAFYLLDEVEAALGRHQHRALRGAAPPLLPTARSSSSSRIRSGRWRRPTSSTASPWARTVCRRSCRGGSRSASTPSPDILGSGFSQTPLMPPRKLAP